MRFLLFLLGLTFFLIFYFFSSKIDNTSGVIGSIFLEGNIYVFISLFFIALIFRSEKIVEKKEDDEQEYKRSFSRVFIDFVKKMGIYFFRDILYFASLLVFYIASYLLFAQFFQIENYDLILLFLNLIVIALFFIEHKSLMVSSLLRANVILISIYYIFSHSFILIFSHGDISLLSITNSLLILMTLYAFLYHSRSQKRVYEGAIYFYFMAFCVLETMVGTQYFLGKQALIFPGVSLSYALVLSYSEEVQRYAKIPKKLAAMMSMILFHLTIILSAGSLFIHGVQDYFLLLSLTLSGIYLFLYYTYFGDALALTMSLLGGILVMYFLESWTLSEQGLIYIPLFVLGWGITELFGFHKNLINLYLTHTLAFLVNLISLILFFVSGNVSILYVSILLFCESVFLFFLYTSFHKKRIGSHL